MEVEFLGRVLPSPVVLASGIWGSTVSLLVRAARAGCGAVTAKSCGPTPRAGHVNPSTLDWGGGLINAIGLANPGVEAELDLLDATRKQLVPTGSALIASIFAGTPAEFGWVAERVATAMPDFIEVNISCPNVHSEFGDPFAADPQAAAEVTRAVVRGVARQGIPVIVKLAPNVPNIGRIGKAVVNAGASALCAINTMPGMCIDAESGQPLLANRSGGVSGPAIKPIALKCVYDLVKACPGVPIIGTGGITSGVDAIEMVMAGATLVGVGSAVYYRGADTLTLIANEMDNWLREHSATLDEIHGLAHREPQYPTQPTGAPIPVAH